MDDTINLSNTKKIIEDIVKNTIHEFSKMQNKETRKRVFHNTKLLMEHYISLREHSEKAVSNLKDAKLIRIGNKYLNDVINPDDYAVNKDYRDDEHEIQELVDQDELYIKSIEQSKFRTFTMLIHIDVALELLKKKAYMDGREDWYQAFIDYYVYGESYTMLQVKFHTVERNLRRWMNAMCRDLGVFLFGVDGLQLV